MENIENKPKNEDGLKKAVEKQTLGYILAGFGFVTGLAWNEAIKALINFIFPFAVSSLLAEFIYAIILTLLVVVIGRYLAKLSK